MSPPPGFDCGVEVTQSFVRDPIGSELKISLHHAATNYKGSISSSNKAARSNLIRL